jgi:hypothetical protein
MKPSHVVTWLSSLIAALALAAASIGLFYMNGGSSFPFPTLHGLTVQIYGQGLYAYDTSLVALGYRAGDAVTLVVGVPLLVLSLLLYRRGSLKGSLWLAGTLAYFLYTYGSMTFGAAYNSLFLVYVALFSASLFALVLTLASFDVQGLPAHFSADLPRRTIGNFLIVTGMILVLVWLVLSIVPALLQGKAPLEVASYTTFITGAVDLGVVAPALVLVGSSLLRRAAIGYLLAPMMLVFTVVLGFNLIAAGITQLLSGAMSAGQAMGFTVPFAILTLCALWLTVSLFRHVWEAAAIPAAYA